MVPPLFHFTPAVSCLATKLPASRLLECGAPNISSAWRALTLYTAELAMQLRSFAFSRPTQTRCNAGVRL